VQVTIIKKVKTDKGWKFEPVEFHGNGKIRPDPRPHTFYLDWYEDGKRKREAVGKFAPQAVARRDRKQHLLTSAALGIKAIDPDQPNGTPLKDATDAYLDDIRLTKKPKTYGGGSNLMDYIALEDKLQRCDNLSTVPEGSRYSGDCLHTAGMK
jgi:hypothetical protein